MLLSSSSNSSPEITPKTRIAYLQAIQPQNLRLNISGSAALPTPTKSAWTNLSTGNILLERYGMTEIGMALSCGLDPSTRVDGSVGFPLPGVEIRLVDPDTNTTIPANDYTHSGEIQLRGPTIFKEYFRNPEATAKEFLIDESGDGKGKWFKTGDIAIRHPPLPASPSLSTPSTALPQKWAQGPTYQILGRQSSDIIKTGGEKVSALEVERELLSLPNVKEAAVVGVPSEKWGQKIVALVVLRDGVKDVDGKEGWTPLSMRRALQGKLARYKIPHVLRVVKGIERNAMGKSEFNFFFLLTLTLT
jgi:acyl-CoA synthetase (AMP-forming)/AMP-acid ligase II